MHALIRISAIALLATGCNPGAYDVRVDIRSEQVLENSDAIDVLILAGGCPNPLPGDNDAPLMGTLRSWTSTGTDTTGPFEELPPALYGFFARARVEGIGCALALGCVERELPDERDSLIVIPVETNDACCVPSAVEREVDAYDCCTRVRTRLCGLEGRWGDFGAWVGCQPDMADGTSVDCAPGTVDTETQGGCCGSNPRRDRTCRDDCSWGDWSDWDRRCNRCTGVSVTCVAGQCVSG